MTRHQGGEASSEQGRAISNGRGSSSDSINCSMPRALAEGREQGLVDETGRCSTATEMSLQDCFGNTKSRGGNSSEDLPSPLGVQQQQQQQQQQQSDNSLAEQREEQSARGGSTVATLGSSGCEEIKDRHTETGSR